MIAALSAALVTGFLGSLHCAGMCGPLVVAGATRGGAVAWSSLGGYLGGRLLSYSLVGALMGALGAHALCRLPVDAVQWTAMGLVAVFAIVRGGVLLGWWSAAPLARGAARLRPAMAWISAMVPRRGIGLGLATGILPCGMLIPAWMLAASTGAPMSGALVMAAFWAATTPGLVAPALGARALQLRAVPPWLQGGLWIALGVWVALRPLLNAAHAH